VRREAAPLDRVTVIWDESVYPWQELAVIDIEKTLDWEESLLTTFSVKNMPKTLAAAGGTAKQYATAHCDERGN
jgi:hypothetical protein